jgi:excinuclease ABC subunit A
MLLAEDFSTNTVEGACPECHGIGRVYEVPEDKMVPDPTLTIRERAIASWPKAWHGHQLRDVLVALGYDVDVPWQDLPREHRDWILYTEETPHLPVHSRLTLDEAREAIAAGAEPTYSGTFVGARKYVLDTFANTKSAGMKRRVAEFLSAGPCPVCHGKKLRPDALSVTIAGLDIAEFSALPLHELMSVLRDEVASAKATMDTDDHPSADKLAAFVRLGEGLIDRLRPIVDLGLGYLSLDRTTPTLSGGELQRLRLATQLTSDLFGVVYVLDEPSAGLHPQDVDALLGILDGLKDRGNSLFVVEHSVDIMRHADWLVDIGPGAGERGGDVLYSGPTAGLAEVDESVTRGYVFGGRGLEPHEPRHPRGWMKLANIRRNNLHDISLDLPLGSLTAVTGISGSGKSSLVSQVLPALVGDRLGTSTTADEPASDDDDSCSPTNPRTLMAPSPGNSPGSDGS